MGRMRTFIDNAGGGGEVSRVVVAVTLAFLSAAGVCMAVLATAVWVVSACPWAAVGLLFVGLCGAVWYASGEPRS